MRDALTVFYGSSPLARGLRAHCPTESVNHGIIPARAGFTVPPKSVPAGNRGSSPLARGLLAPVSRMTCRWRIIPARAGFTREDRADPVQETDHPRSRGVYGRMRSRLVRRNGSSPLARGLPIPNGVIDWDKRIIPARAGFTRSQMHQCCPFEDHPRSRGVYGPLQVTYPGYFGSSPLARGLPVADGAPVQQDGIIPARAGFTVTAATRPVVLPDHPRSRGVYGDGRHSAGRVTGSSPLARGLLNEIWVHDGNRRIIPARAGFTLHSFLPFPLMTDHPRSRGVYPAPCTSRPTSAGSSPLARGLRLGQWPVGVRVRIIPARAGFTRSVAGRRSGARDHPRSRGVYAPLACWAAALAGSSPLARGLLER